MGPAAAGIDSLLIEETMRRVDLRDFRQELRGKPNNGVTVYSIVNSG